MTSISSNTHKKLTRGHRQRLYAYAVLIFNVVIVPAPDARAQSPTPDKAAAWRRLEAALLGHDADWVRTLLHEWPDAETRHVAHSIAHLINDEPLPASIDDLLSGQFAADSPWPARLRPLLERLKDASLVDADPRLAVRGLSVLDTEDLCGQPVLNFITRCRLERQLRFLAALTSDRKTYAPLHPVEPLELAFREYHPWQDQMFVNTEVNERLMKLGSPHAAFFYIQRQPDQKNPMAVFLLKAVDCREVQPPVPLWTIPHGPAGPALMIEVDGPSPPGLKGITEPMGGGVSLVFRDPIRADCERVRQPWPTLPPHADPSIKRLDDAKRFLHDQVQTLYRDDVSGLQRDSISFTAVHEAAHQALHDMVGTHIYGPSQYFVFGGPRNVIVEVNEALADLAVINVLVKERSNRKLLLLAFYGLMDARPVNPAKGVWLDDPYQWKSALILRCAKVRDGVLAVDFAEAGKYVELWEQSLGAALQDAALSAILPPMIDFLIERKDMVKDEDAQVNFDRLQAWMDQLASEFTRKRPRLSATDARTAAVTQLIHDMAVSSNAYFISTMVKKLTDDTLAVQRSLAKSLGADLEHRIEFLNFVTASLREKT